VTEHAEELPHPLVVTELKEMSEGKVIEIISPLAKGTKPVVEVDENLMV